MNSVEAGKIQRAAVKAAGWYSATGPHGEPTKLARKTKDEIPPEFKVVLGAVDMLREHLEEQAGKHAAEMLAIRIRLDRLERAKGESR